MTAIGNFEPTAKTAEDVLLWLRLAQRGAFVFMPQITAYYRQRAGSITADLKGPYALAYLVVLDWVKDRPEFAAHRAVIQRIRAQCHHVGATYYRRLGETKMAVKHALGAVRARPGSGFIGAALRALIRTGCSKRSRRQTTERPRLGGRQLGESAPEFSR